MIHFVEVVAALEAGHSVKRDQTSNRNGTSELFLKKIGKCNFLFSRTFDDVAKTVCESPASFDWNDIASTEWEIVS